MFCILTADRAGKQKFLYTGCTCANKLITGKQAIRGRKQVTLVDKRKNAKRSDILYTRVTTSRRSVTRSHESHGERTASAQRVGAASPLLAQEAEDVPSGALNMVQRS